ncbi:hypothetical protein FA15DRAFT_695936 [Coprinopsis marcescibilis]|uniref:Uncharacterized protein n=1 Tax=Coprinopsis marcescibilis TaxID=230819 RepID=A0A5C3KP88_COPMA|nr:hypothetical protein FA15DRAFT_695936 [Coprinopsis marcescibilis]
MTSSYTVALGFASYYTPGLVIDKQELRAAFGAHLFQWFALGIQTYICGKSFSAFFSSARETRQSRIIYMSIMFLVLMLSCLVLISETVVLLAVFELHSEMVGRTVTPGAWPTWGRITGLLSFGCTGITAVITEVVSEAGLRSYPYKTFQVAYFLSAIGSCAISTGLIVIRLWQMKSRMRALNLLDGFGYSLYSRIPTILIESALPFTLMGILAAIITAVVEASRVDGSTAYRNTPLELTKFVVVFLWVTSCSFAPTLIIHRVTMGASWVCDPTTGGRITHTLVFNRDPDRTNTSLSEQQSIHPSNSLHEA